MFGGSRRTIVWDDMNPVGDGSMIHDRGVDRCPPIRWRDDERRQALISYRIGDIHVPALPEREALRNVMAEFAGDSDRPAAAYRGQVQACACSRCLRRHRRVRSTAARSSGPASEEG